MDERYAGEPPQEVRDGSRVLHDDGDWVIVAPLSYEAAGWWSGWARWCTRWDADDFDDYDDAGRMLIFVHKPTERRWQLHAAREEFRAETGKVASWRGFLMRHPEVAWALADAVAGVVD